MPFCGIRPQILQPFYHLGWWQELDFRLWNFLICIPSLPSENTCNFSGGIFYIAWALWESVCRRSFSDPFCLQVGKSEDPLLQTEFGTSFQSANLQSVREKDSPKTFAGWKTFLSPLCFLMLDQNVLPEVPCLFENRGFKVWVMLGSSFMPGNLTAADRGGYE